MEICIVSRNVNGTKVIIYFKSFEEAYEYCKDEAENCSDDEILLVIFNRNVIYSALSDKILCWEELTGFFA